MSMSPTETPTPERDPSPIPPASSPVVLRNALIQAILLPSAFMAFFAAIILTLTLSLLENSEQAARADRTIARSWVVHKLQERAMVRSARADRPHHRPLLGRSQAPDGHGDGLAWIPRHRPVGVPH